jgi:glycosidase
MRLRNILAAALIAAAFPSLAPAGPVPGVETFDKRPVEFAVPPSLEVWDIGEGEYLVTFKWTPEAGLEKPGVAGSFNGWKREDAPMEGPDANGQYKVTLRLKSGTYEYKFVSGTEGWHTDPLNPDGSPDGHGGSNSVLRLGLSALLRGKEAKRGDREIEMRATAHDPQDPTKRDVLSDREAVLRIRALRNDIEEATIVLSGLGPELVEKPMAFAASDEMFDYYEVHLKLEEAPAAGATYRFIVSDGDRHIWMDGEWPLRFDASARVVTPQWARHAIWYQIMPDRFRDGTAANNPEKLNDPRRSKVTHPWRSEWYMEQPWERENGQTFWRWSMYNRLYGGDLQGLKEKLGYLKELGVTAIYLNPVFEATSSHKYNGKSYMHIDDGYGVAGEFMKSWEREDPLDASTWEINASDQVFLDFLAAAKKRGFRVIIDGVFNHLGEESPFFLDTKEKGKASRYADWWNIKSWEPFEHIGWAGFGGLPEFRKTETGLASAALTQHIYDVTRRWMDPDGDGDPSDGIDGWRLDVPNELPKQFWVEWRKVVKATNPDAYIVGEIWGPAEEWLDGTAFDAVMNYQFARVAFGYFANRERKLTATQFDQALARLRIRYPRAHTEVLQNLYDSHDTDRWVSRIANPDLEYDSGNRIQDGAEYFDRRPAPEAYRRLRLMALFQNTYVGAPMIYYGTEVGMYGADDPRNRMPMWWEDMMPYDDASYKVDKDLFRYFQSLFALRRAHTDALATGDYRTVLADDAKDCFAYLRWMPDARDALLVVLNNSNAEQRVTIPAPEGDALEEGWNGVKVLFGKENGNARASRDGAMLTVTLAPVSGIVVKVERD